MNHYGTSEMEGKSWVNLFDRYRAAKGRREKIRGFAVHEAGMSAGTPGPIQTLRVPGAFLHSVLPREG